jgi:hypothetical protein
LPNPSRVATTRAAILIAIGAIYQHLRTQILFHYLNKTSRGFFQGRLVGSTMHKQILLLALLLLISVIAGCLEGDE